MKSWIGKELIKKGPDVIKAIKPFAKTGAKKISEWKNKASAARIKAVSTEIQALAHKTASTMGRLGSKEARLKWYKKAANKRRYSDDYYKKWGD